MEKGVWGGCVIEASSFKAVCSSFGGVCDVEGFDVSFSGIFGRFTTFKFDS